MDSGMGDILYGMFEGNAQVCNVWLNDSKRNANLNWLHNDWNDNYWFAFARDCIYFSPREIGEAAISRS